jgi:glucosamine-6-phosphate deaminase
VQIIIAADRNQMGDWVAKHAALDLQRTIAEQGDARLLIATGSSQFEVLDALSKHDEVDWSRVTGFHLDEYIGLASSHPASFCGYLQQRFVDRVPLKQFHYLRGDADPRMTIESVGTALQSHTSGRPSIDVALVGIGENGHLAFNDPPADFDTDAPYLIVTLDEACRQQQVGEGWFASLADVPTQAISMSIRQIMKCDRIYCSVPDERKAEAVRNSVEGKVSPQVPASILQSHSNATLIIDRAAAQQLANRTLERATIL